MRLVNGGRRCEGRVEVWYNGTWGTVCSEKLYRVEAEVICKQLECGPLAYIEYRAWIYGQGSGPIWIDKMKCSSHESALWQCQFDPWGKHNCDHREDAGVSCKDAEMPETTRGKDCVGGNESKSRRLPDFSHDLLVKREAMGPCMDPSYVCQLIQIYNCGLMAAATIAPEGLTYYSITAGERCVMTPEVSPMPMSSADSWAVALLFGLQERRPLPRPQVISGWMK
ncbi:scavenger receptor cysteine-rich type 1 protein M130-like [Amblyraja radiata]|uniref:scavenger receptor cysteine-rich type 1 protein M130-like n=1 Tax=Amblyraja radiata TaxID=386614 RepID=UPI001403B003|nr:scavenger receptor cysteine-rich type 1 protein M130-like [Amblyraja radiata]